MGHQHSPTLPTRRQRDKAQPQFPPIITTHVVIEPLKCSGIDRGAEGADTTTPGGHCRAGPNAAVLLHPNRPPDGMKNTKSGATQRAGPRHFRHWMPLSRARGPPTRHSARLSCVRGPPTRHMTPRSVLISGIDVEAARRGAPPLRELSHAARPPPWFEIITLLFPSHEDTALEPEDRRCRPRRKGSAVLNTPPRSAAGQVITDCHCR